MGTSRLRLRDLQHWPRRLVDSRWLVGLLILSLVACGGAPDSSPVPSDTLVLESLHVIVPSANLPKGLTTPLSARGRLSDGSQVDLTDTAVWTSSDTAVAAVDSSGILAALGAGTATVTASVSTISAQADIVVAPPTLLSLDVEPPSQSLAKGLMAAFRAYGRYTDGSRQDVTDQVAWSSTDPLLAETATGQVTALASGATRVEASLAGVTADARLTVTDATLVALEVSPASAPLARGTTLALTATGRYSDNTWADVSTEARWQSSDDAVATVAATGEVSGELQGTATVTASLDGVSAGAVVTVTDAVLTSLDIAPGNATLGEGKRLSLTATGIFSDGSRQDLSGAVLWDSSDAGVATIDSGAVVEALTPGTVQVTADLAGIHAATPLRVKAKALTAIHVTPGDPSLALGGSLGLAARGDFDDGSSQALSDQVTWESQDTAVAVVDARGVITPVATGSVRIAASQGGTTGSVLLTVTSATLDSIEVVFDSGAIAAGYRTGLAAIGHYSDGTTQDLTEQVSWTSSDRAVADVQPGTLAEVKGQATGSATIWARFGTVESQQTLTVSDAVLTSLDISPAAPSVVKGGVLALSALGHYSDGSQQDLTGQVVWSSADANLAGIDNSAGGAGRVSGVDSGNVTVGAALDGVSATTTLTVEDDPLAPLALTVVASPNVILADGTDSAALKVVVLAAGAGATVADGTPIQFQVTQGGGVLATGSATTSGGQATVDIQAAASGLIVVQATVAGGAIVNDAALYAVSDFSEVLAVATPFLGTVVDGSVQQGSRFGLFVFNLSNREFSLNRFRFSYAGEVKIDSDDPLRLNQNLLPGGSHAGAVVELANDFPNDGFSAEFLLSDPASGQDFSVEGSYSLSE